MKEWNFRLECPMTHASEKLREFNIVFKYFYQRLDPLDFYEIRNINKKIPLYNPS